jgi:nucleoside-diphosphate-sugar epimerase
MEAGMTVNHSALVLGATGGIGGEVARLLAARGWKVRALHRNPGNLGALHKASEIAWYKGDAMSPADIEAAASGVSVIVHAVNPPGYRNWGNLVLPMLDNTIAAARSHGARILLPGTVYNFGPDALPNPQEDSPQNPVTAKGRIRAEMERRLNAAALAGTQVLIVRAGDFFGPGASNNWFSQALVKPGKPVSTVTYPGKRGIGHQWAYLPDVAETMVRLLEKINDLNSFAVFHMTGHWDADGSEMIDAIRRSAGNPRIKVRPFPWRLMRLLSPFVPIFRELEEMRYLWTAPVRMENVQLTAVLGAEPHTSLDAAVSNTLAWLGCLDQQQQTVPGPMSLSSLAGARETIGASVSNDRRADGAGGTVNVRKST